MTIELIDRVQTALAGRRIVTAKSRRRDRKWLHHARRHVTGVACGEHSAFAEGCDGCREARTVAWYAMDCPPMAGRWYREVPR